MKIARNLIELIGHTPLVEVSAFSRKHGLHTPLVVKPELFNPSGSVKARTAFAMIPFFKPMMGIIMITGMAFGSGAGFLTGAVTGFVSNFILGQGPWNTWQMFAYGVGGALAGFLAKKGIMSEEKKVSTAIIGYVIIQAIVGPLLDTSSIFTMGGNMQQGYVLAIYGAGLVPNAIHGLATFLTLLLACKPMMEKLNRMKLKYGMMSEDFDEI